MVENSSASEQGSYSEDNPPITGILPSLKWRILSIAALSVFSLLAYLGVLFFETGKSAALLSDIQNKTYPIQEHMLEATHALDFIHRELQIAAITGDEDSIDSTLALAETYRYELSKVEELESDNKTEIGLLLEKFEDYYVSAKILANRLLDTNSDLQLLRAEGRVTTAKYTDLMQSAIRFQDERKNELKNSIASTTASARWMIGFLLWTGLCAVVIVCYSATRTASLISSRIEDIVSVLKRIAQNENDLSARISLTGRDEMTELGYWFNSFIAKLENITTKATNEITKVANTDFLTGLENRRSLLNSIDSLISKDLEQGNVFTLFFLDLDNFKPINDELGHEAGDQLIQEVALRLNTFCSDVLVSHATAITAVSPSDDSNRFDDIALASRLGGDEFVLLVTNLAETDEAAKVADLMITAIASPYSLEAGQCAIGASVGIAQYPKHGVSASTLIEHADIALYEAKGRGKNQHVFYATGIALRSERQRMLEEGLLDCKLNDEFTVVFQPEFSLTNAAKMVSVDASLRWHSSDLGEVSPDDFMSIAEEKNILSVLDELLIDSVCQQIEYWESLGLELSPISVRVSAKSISQINFLDSLRAIVSNYRLDRGQVVIVITDSLLLVQNNVLGSTINVLKDMRLSVGIDDLSIGSSSIEILMNNQVDQLALNKSLISNCHTDAKKQAIVKTVCSLARQLNIATHAVGVENKEEYTFLKAAGCLQGNGNYLQMPLVAPEFCETYMTSAQSEIRNASHG